MFVIVCVADRRRSTPRLIVAVVRFRERRGREPVAVRRRARRAAPGARRRSRCSRSPSSSSASIAPTTRARSSPPGPTGSASRRRPRSASRGCRRRRSPRARSRRPARSRSPARSRPRRARWRSTRSPSSGCGASSTRAATPGQRTFSYGELVVPVDTTVILNDHLHRRPPQLVGARARRPGPGRRPATCPDLVQGRRGRPLRGPLDDLLRHRLPGDARLGPGRQRARVPGLRRGS